MGDQQRDVFRSFTQGRDLHLVGGEPEIEIASKPPVRRQAAQVLIRSRNDVSVTLLGHIGAQGCVGLLLQQA